MKKCLRKTGQTARLVLAFVGGMMTWAQRDGLPGGEALILPLIVLLIYLGWQLGAMWREARERFQ